MLDRQNLLFGRKKYLIGAALLLCAAIICAAISVTNNDDFTVARREILLRKIGHELLLQSGDSTSRVLPVKKIADYEYQISFENELTFQPDALVGTTQRLLARDPLASDYVVNVLTMRKTGVAYGYAISKSKKDGIVACAGRRQPKAHYAINIKFKPTGISAVNNGVLIGGLPLLAFIGFMFLRSAKPLTPRAKVSDTSLLAFGSSLFDPQNRKLTVDGKQIELTGTESRVLLIFALSFNEVIERSRLQKEIWEDEGVIVGRSLDMFISKLRKKLEGDPHSHIVVVRGKGYKLECWTT